MPFSFHSRAAASGFSLIEALVALAVVGFALAAMTGTFSDGRLGYETVGDVDAALALANEKIAGAEATAALRPDSSEGVFAGRFQWRLSIAPYDDPTGPARRPDPADASLRLFRIAVSVAWRDGHRGRQLALSTLRLAPAPP